MLAGAPESSPERERDMEATDSEMLAVPVIVDGGDVSGGGGALKESPSPTPSPTPSPPSANGGGGSGGDVMEAEVPSGFVQEVETGTGQSVDGGGAAVPPQQSSGGSGGKKRGRPRKYGSEDDSKALALYPPAAAAAAAASDGKRRRGRPRGSGKRQLLSSFGEWFGSSAGGSFIPHVVTVAAGEDVAARIISFSHKGPRSICVLSANGTISNVTLRQAGSSGGTLTYEGRFELLSLTGSFTITENSGVQSKTGGLSVSLAGPDGRVVGGVVAGSLIAATPIQAVIGSFMPNILIKERKRKSNPEPSTNPATETGIGLSTAARPISQAPPDDECKTPNLPMFVGNNHGDTNNSMNRNPNPGSAETAVWHGLQSPMEHEPSPDINI